MNQRATSNVAPDLAACLMACRIELTERRTAAVDADITQTKYLILTRTPDALVLPCADATCRDGGHDFTEALLTGFRGRKPKFRSTHTCGGGVRAVPCGRVLTFVATAEYRRTT